MRNRLGIILAGIALCISFQAYAQSAEELKRGFEKPDQSAKPQVWWHWMNGNITEEGLKKDLEWMDRIGIGGVHIFDANMKTPLVVDHKVNYMSDEWKGIFSRTLQRADSLRMEVTIASSPGFSSSGGPWVKEKDAMKRICWREMTVEGGRLFEGALPEPYDVTGRFQDVRTKSQYRYYEDIAVLAVRLPEAERDFELMKPAQMLDAGEAITVRAVSFRSKARRAERHSVAYVCRDSLQCSDDGKEFRTVCGLPYGPCPQQTIDIEPVKARYFRLKTDGNARSWTVHTVTKVNHAEEKAGFGSSHDIRFYPTPDTEDAVRDVVDISSMYTSGTLRWNVPEGRWKIFRFGAALTGKMNHPASPEATGLEVDKLDPEAFCNYFRTFLDMMKSAAGGLLGDRGIQYVLEDSYEAGFQNWTRNMLAEFRKRRGYDALEWMPALTGMVLRDSRSTDCFLNDWRNTLGELFAENYANMSRLIKDEYGMRGCYIEAHANGTVFPADGMAIKRTATIPMGEMWVYNPTGWSDRHTEGMADIHESASTAHIYGQKIVAAESLTLNGAGGQAYRSCPENLKRTADYEFKAGVNRFVIHDSAHQPCDDKFPGLGLGKYGQWFNRHETWAELAGGWISYLARSSYMLQRGMNVSDVLWYFGENQTVTAYYSKSEPDVPRGYEFDYAGADALLRALDTDGENITAPSGAKYRVMYIDPMDAKISVPVLRRILDLVERGAKICGARPSCTPSLSDGEEEWTRLCSEIWDRSRGNVLECSSLKEGIDRFGILPDVIWTGNEKLEFLHHRVESAGAEIYWISNPSDDVVEKELSFRTSGLIPSLWHPETGEISFLEYSADGSRTSVKLRLEKDEAVFVVFTSKPMAPKHVSLGPVVREAEVVGPWKVAFQENRGAPASMVMDALSDLSRSEDPGVRYFSGTASYSSSFKAKKGEAVVIDLGDVKNLAQVYLNGRLCGTLWKSPFRLDVSSSVKPGLNKLEIRVTNLWVNRLIGDCQKDVKTPVTFTSYEFYKAEDSVQPSGLIGPVRLEFHRRQK